MSKTPELKLPRSTFCLFRQLDLPRPICCFSQYWHLGFSCCNDRCSWRRFGSGHNRIEKAYIHLADLVPAGRQVGGRTLSPPTAPLLVGQPNRDDVVPHCIDGPKVLRTRGDALRCIRSHFPMSITRADRTAIRRSALSRPVAVALQDRLIHEERTFFDYGCGRGDDLLRLHKMGIPVSGWDPAFFPDEERSPADVVNLGYVVNVIEDPTERVVVLSAAWELARKVLIVSARLDWDATDAAVDFQGDGIVTRKRTFQKFFTQEELRQWIEQTLDTRAIAAAPGVFYVFREEADAQSFAVNRVFRQRRIPDIEQCQEFVSDHKELVETLIAFVTERGRLPVNAELATAPQLTQVFGSVARAFALLRRATGVDRWDSIRERTAGRRPRVPRSCCVLKASSARRSARRTPARHPRFLWVVQVRMHRSRRAPVLRG